MIEKFYLSFFLGSLKKANLCMIKGIGYHLKSGVVYGSLNIYENQRYLKFYNGNQVDDKIAWGLDGGFQCIHSSFDC